MGGAAAGAFEAGGNIGEYDRFDLRPAFGKGQREGAMPGVAGAERIDHLDLRHGNMDHLRVIKVIDAFRAVSNSEPGVRHGADSLHAFGDIFNAA